MASEELTHELPGVPILLREARGAFAAEIRSYLAGAGLAPLPTNGALIVGALHEGTVPFNQLVNQRRSSIERSKTIERLFELEYLEGAREDPSLTETGHQAAHVVFEAVASLTESLRQHLGEAGMESFVSGLVILIDAKESIERGD